MLDYYIIPRQACQYKILRYHPAKIFGFRSAESLFFKYLKAIAQKARKFNFLALLKEIRYWGNP